MKHPTDNAQDELVRDYCSEAEKLILRADSRDNALRIKEKWCGRFQEECKSMLIAHAAAAYLDQIIMQRWKGEAIHRTEQQ